MLWSNINKHQSASGTLLQDDVSNPGVPFACGLTLEKLSAHTVDEDGNDAFVKDNPLSLLRKVTQLLHATHQLRQNSLTDTQLCHKHIKVCIAAHSSLHSCMTWHAYSLSNYFSYI